MHRLLGIVIVLLAAAGCSEPGDAGADMASGDASEMRDSGVESGCDLSANSDIVVELRTAPDGDPIDVGIDEFCDDPLTGWGVPEPRGAINGESVPLGDIRSGDLVEPGDVVRLAYEIPGDDECREVGFGIYEALDDPGGGGVSGDGDGDMTIPASDVVRWVVVEIQTADTRCEATYGVDMNGRPIEFRVDPR